MIGQYVLDDEGEPQLCDDLLQWAQWMETAGERIVLQTHVRNAFVSTVFLGIDYNHFGGGGPILWETMIFGGRFDLFIRRYRRKLDALRGHIQSVAMVELADAAPRRLKKAMRKSYYELHPQERRRVERALTRVTQLMGAA